jgi:XapX domain-containing protein
MVCILIISANTQNKGHAMNLYVVSTNAGTVVSVFYVSVGMCSPALSAIALLGLVGNVVGEQVIAVAVHLFADSRVREVFGLAESRAPIMRLLPFKAQSATPYIPDD